MGISIHRPDHQAISLRYFILLFALLKIGLNLLAISHFGLQRDELLHLVLGQHLNWGFIEVPPFIAAAGKVSVTIFGDSTLGVRIFPTICSGFLIWFTGLMAIEFGGRKLAIAIACLAVIFSPGMAAGSYLFEPVVFDELWWVLAAWLLIRYIKTQQIKYLYFLGSVIGIGLLTKYTMGLFAAALATGILSGKERKLFYNRHIALAALLAFLIFVPNLIWQCANHFPVLSQMEALRQEQLSTLTRFGFIAHQLVDNGPGILVWLPGLALLLSSAKLNNLWFVPIAFIFTFIFLLVVNGKDYYLFGAYPPLFAAGGFLIEQLLRHQSVAVKSLVITALVLPGILMLPVAMPLLTLRQTENLMAREERRLPFLRFVLLWDDGQMHPISQNYGDMIGWEELTAAVAKTWQGLSPAQQMHTFIYADNYGEASAIAFYGKRYKLPQVISLSSSFALWAPREIPGDYLIYVNESKGQRTAKLKAAFDECRKAAAITDPLSVESGTTVFLLGRPKPVFNTQYQRTLALKRSPVLFKNWENIPSPGVW